MKRKIIFMLFCIVLLFVPDRYVFAQDIDLQAPTVQYKLNSHDSISLKWNKIEGADAYYIYRKDTKTGKKVRYAKPIYDTEITINNLSAETEYIFSVKAVDIKGNICGKESTGIIVTTPNEWYYEDDYNIDYKRKKMKSYYYRTDNAKTKKEEINLGDIKAVDEIIYYDGWYYVIGDYDAISAEKNYPWLWESSTNHPKCAARIKEDGTKKEILLEFYSSEGWGFDYQITDDGIYIASHHLDDYEEKENTEGDKIIRYYSYLEWNWLKKISFKTGKAETLITSCYINWFYYNNGYIYYEYDDFMTLDKDHYGHPVYISDWCDYYSNNPIDQKEYHTYLCKIKSNGKENRILHKHKFDISVDYACVHDKLIIISDGQKIYTSSLSDNIKRKIYESKDYVYNIKLINQYIYFTDYKYSNGNKTFTYYRIKIDGTGLEKQDKPFEWYY